MAIKTPQLHVLIVCFPCQGAINPLLRLAKLLASTGGFLVTFSTTATAGQKILNVNGLSCDHLYPFGDGFLRFDFFDIDYPCVYHRNQLPEFLSKLEIEGRKRLPEMIRRLSDQGRPVSCIVKGDIVPWVSDVAKELGLPLAALWAQSCSSFLTFYHYDKKLVPFPTEENPHDDVEIPGLPLLKWDELHSFLHPRYLAPCMRDLWLRDIRSLENAFRVVLDMFRELEEDAFEQAAKLCPAIKPMGPLFLKTQDNDVGADLQKADWECLKWLDTQPPRSVVYVSFGTVVLIEQDQLDEIAHGVMSTGAPFLWVTRAPGLNSLLMRAGEGDKETSKGLVVEYSPQEKVLGHPSVRCFVTHCGWNSTMEALSLGVPMVAFPQLGDQQTNAKFAVDVFRVAVRMGRGEIKAGEKVVGREEVARCVREATVGPKADEIRRNAEVWKAKAEKACGEGGSSEANLRGFVEEIRGQVVVKTV